MLATALGIPSFRVMGEDLQALTFEQLADAVRRQEAVIAMLPPDVYAAVLAEEQALAADAYAMLRRFNRSMHARVAGYLELGRRCDFRYPWMVVAVLGIVQVMGGLDRARLYGLAGRVASRFGYAFLEQLGDASEDILRRTNRGIFADSVPTVLRAIRAAELRASSPAVADALIDGTAAVLYDAESAALCRSIADGLAEPDAVRSFHALSATTAQHFAREQAIFTHHIASKTAKRKLPAAKSVPAPVVRRGKLSFRPFALPAGFDLRDHAARVDQFGRAFVASVTSSPSDYRIARDHVLARFAI